MTVEVDHKPDKKRRQRKPLSAVPPPGVEHLQLLNEHQVSTLLGVNVKTLRMQRSLGEGLPYVKMPGTGQGGQVRYRALDIERILNDRLVLPSLAAEDSL